VRSKHTSFLERRFYSLLLHEIHLFLRKRTRECDKLDVDFFFTNKLNNDGTMYKGCKAGLEDKQEQEMITDCFCSSYHELSLMQRRLFYAQCTINFDAD